MADLHRHPTVPRPAVLAALLGLIGVAACGTTGPETAPSPAPPSTASTTEPTATPSSTPDAWADLLAVTSTDDVHRLLRENDPDATPAVSFAAAVRADGTEQLRAEVPVDLPQVALRVTCVTAQDADTSLSPVTAELLADDVVVGTHEAPCGGPSGDGLATVTTQGEAVALPEHTVTTVRVHASVDVLVAAGVVGVG